MKILYASTIDIGLEKASAIHFLYLAYALQAEGNEITLVARGNPPNEAKHQLKIHTIPKTTIPAKLKTLFNVIRLLSLLIQLSLSTRFDILYHRDIPLVNYVARIFGIPSIVEVNGIYVDELQAAGMRKAGIWLYRQREKCVVKDVHKVICVTEGIRDQLVKRYQVPFAQCIVIPNATDTALFKPLPKPDCQKQVGLSPKCYNVGFVGKFQPWIDFDILLDAVQILQTKNIPIHCILIGDGDSWLKVKQQIEDRQLSDTIQMTGQIPHHQVPSWIGAFDVCIAPFTHIRNALIGLSPLKLFEYMACARPVIATALPSIAETLEASQGGLLYETGDSNTLAQQLLSLYQAPNLRERMGTHGREYVIKHHSWRGVAQRLELIMQELANK